MMKVLIWTHKLFWLIQKNISHSYKQIFMILQYFLITLPLGPSLGFMPTQVDPAVRKLDSCLSEGLWFSQGSFDSNPSGNWSCHYCWSSLYFGITHQICTSLSYHFNVWKIINFRTCPINCLLSAAALCIFCAIFTSYWFLSTAATVGQHLTDYYQLLPLC